MHRSLRMIAASLAVLSTFTVGSVFAQAPSPSPSPVAKMSGKKAPVRDPKTGRFIKGSGVAPAKPGKAAKKKSNKPLPLRDAKGRFIKKGTTPAPSPSPAAKKP